jgi:hypothetical protein
MDSERGIIARQPMKETAHGARPNQLCQVPREWRKCSAVRAREGGGYRKLNLIGDVVAIKGKRV